MGSIRERLAALAAPLGIQLPEEYVAYLENGGAGILLPSGWRPSPIEELEADIHGGRWRKVELFAHNLRAAAAEYLSGGWQTVPGPDGSEFATERLGRGFRIGEGGDGESVFLDADTLGVYAYVEYADEPHVEQWAPSFAALVAHGPQWKAEPGAAADPAS